MDRGSVWKRAEGSRWLPVALVGVIFIGTAIVVFSSLGRVSTFIVTALLTVAGAVLGSVVRTNLSSDLVRHQARPATRELFDHSSRLAAVVQSAEAHQRVLEGEMSEGAVPDVGRVADWFGSIALAIRHEIESTATAIENWGDLAKDVLENERKGYIARQREAEDERAD